MLSSRSLPTSSLWRAFKTRGDQSARQVLIERHVHLVRGTVTRTRVPTACQTLEYRDLIGAGFVGLVKAVDRFDPARGVMFETYAISLIKGAILQAMRDLDLQWVPRLVREEQKQLEAAHQRLETRLGRPATEEEIAAELGISNEKLDKWLSNVRRTNLLGLDDLRMGSDRRPLSEVLPADSPGLPESVIAMERQRALISAVDRLPERERYVIVRRYREDATFAVISQELDTSESRAHQLHQQAITRLRQSLSPFADAA